MSFIGHNNGPSMQPGRSWRKHVWTKARSDLLPKLPVEVVRMRVKRAKELGLDYKTYAGVRASTGRDVVAFLFSSNALRILKTGMRLPVDRQDKLSALRRCDRIAIVHAPLIADDILKQNVEIDDVAKAPGFIAGWSEIRADILNAVHLANAPTDGVVLVGDTALEREWSEAGRLAGYITADTYFGERL